MHEKIPEEFFDILGSPFASDFTWYYLLAVTAINLVGIVVQPHMIVVGGGSAKDEMSARTGILIGNFIKRFLTILWTLTGLIALALYAREIADPDLVWGHATLDLLRPVGLGLVGLMIVALMAALMSSASCYILVASSLLVRNMYSWMVPDRPERHYVLVARIASAVAIVGGVFFSIYYYDVFDQLKVAWELPVIFAATVWVASQQDGRLGDGGGQRRVVLYHPDPAAGGQSRLARQREIPGCYPDPRGCPQLRGQGIRRLEPQPLDRGLEEAGCAGHGRHPVPRAAGYR
jgi:hypothetical protein